MKLDKKVILTAIICFLISGTIGVVAYKAAAKDITFTPTNENWQVDNVEDAVNDLYQKNNSEYLSFNIGSNNDAQTKHQTRIWFSNYKRKYKYFKITGATPVDSRCNNVYFGTKEDMFNGGDVSLGVEYLTSNISNNLVIYTTGSNGCFYQIGISLYN